MLDFVYFPSKNLGLAVGLANIYYAHNKNHAQYDTVTSNTYGFSFANNNLNFSIFYVFGGKG